MAYDFTGVNTKYLSGSAPLTAPPFSLACWAWQDVVVSSKNTLLYLGVSSTDSNFWQLYTDNASPPKLGVIMKDGGTFSGNLSALTAATGPRGGCGRRARAVADTYARTSGGLAPPRRRNKFAR